MTVISGTLTLGAPRGLRGLTGEATQADIDAAVAAVLGGVASPGNTLAKLYALVLLRAPLDGASMTNLDVATQSAGNNSTKASSTAFVQQELTSRINALLNGAPAALNTLKELADAINDDASYAATITAALGDKQPLDAELTALAGLASAANKIPMFSGSGSATLLTLDTDGTLAGNSDTKLATQKAVKTYADGLITAIKNGVSSAYDTLAEIATWIAGVESAWTPYTPTITLTGTGALTTVSASGRYKQIGKTVHLWLTITITDHGTAAGTLNATLPVNSVSGVEATILGRDAGVTGWVIQGRIQSAASVISNITSYATNSIIADGAVLNFSGTYEAA